jgi:alpha-N-arabinofuranosidase
MMCRHLGIACAALLLTTTTAWATDDQSQGQPARLVVHADQGQYLINRNIYGQFAEHLGRCIYDGLWVGEDSDIPNIHGVRKDAIEALKEMKIPALRWPGGCFADNYHWRDGIGPVDKRPLRTNVWWGNAPEPNRFGTHEFLDLCELLGCEPVVCGNVGSGAPKELAQWVEYVNADQGSLADLRRKNGRDKPWGVHYWAIGNESWGCGGNMTPEYYSDLMLRFTTFVRPYGGTTPYAIAVGAGGDDTQWTEVLMRTYRRKSMFQGLSLHYYTLPTGDWAHKGQAIGFGEDQWASTIRRTLHMKDLVERHSKVMDGVDPDARVGLVVDEWGTWYDPAKDTNPSALFQQNSLRDAVVAGINLNIFNNHCRRVRMANLAQTVNVLQSVILTRGRQMVLTPTYYVFRMYRVHQDATMLPVELTSPDYTYGKETVPALTASASRDQAGVVHVSLTNADPHRTIPLACDLVGAGAAAGDWKVFGDVVTADRMDAYNDFGKEPEVKLAEFNGAKVIGGKLTVELPPKSVVMLTIQGAAAK